MKAILLVLLLLVVIGAAPGAAQNIPAELIRYADAIFYNGKVLTVDKNFTIAQAVALRDGKILAVGTSADIQRLAGPSTRRIDLGGRSVVPGFIDSDGDNAFAGGDLYKDTMVNGVVGKKVRGKNVPEMLEQVRKLVQQAMPGSSVYVRMADEFVADLSKLTAQDLDKLAPNNPLMLSLSSSEGVVNTLMLEKAFAAVFNGDYMAVTDDKIDELLVDMTIVGGKVMYQRSGAK